MKSGAEGDWATELVDRAANQEMLSECRMAAVTRRQSVGIALSACVSALSASAFAATEDFYREKSIDLVIGFPPGASNDLYARTLAAHLSRYIAGTPSVVPRNMPGAGSLFAAAHMYSIAPKDGTSVGIIAPTVPLDERLGAVGARFKSADFGWIGRINSLVNVIFVRSDSIKSINEAFSKSVRLSATGAGSAITIYPSAMNVILGTRFDIIKGYSGSAEGMLAVDRHEVDGHCTGWDTLKTSHPDWLKSGKIRLLVQFALQRHRELESVPTAVELTKTARQKELMSTVVKASEIGISFFTTPGAPAERLAILRSAFANCMQDRDFVADLRKLNLGLEPLPGESVSSLVSEVGKVPDALVPELQQVYSTVASAK
jgi:tripartite-type tricarboxylate transporter receptor subunit TctC